LAGHLDDPDLRIIEVSSAPDGAEYRQGHIPGAFRWYWKDALWARAAEEAVALVTEHAQGESGSAWCRDWLVKYYRKHDRHREALVWQLKVFLLRLSAILSSAR
jgi:3-mercaptopyruvate sulfurtransferase SseA